MTAPPTGIRSLKQDRCLEIEWPDGLTARLGWRKLRGECPCAGCVDEITGVRTLDVDALPDDIHPVDIGFTGNYALKIRWSDQHDTGLFTWDRLHALCRQSPDITAD